MTGIGKQAVMSQKGKQSIKQGNIPNTVWNNSHLQNYIKSGGAFGYIGSPYRTLKTDRLLIAAWTALGMSDNEIAEGMTWGSARHMADAFYDAKNDTEIVLIAVETGKYLMKQPEFGKSYKEN